MGELYNPFPKLPKNIRQIGDRDEIVKLYVEDYVNTYLKRLYPTGGQDLRVGILLGSVEQHDGTPFVFIDGALEMEEVVISGEKVTFSEASWKKAYQSIEETFPKRTVQGWFLCGAPGCTLSPLNYWKQHGQYFGGKNQLMYLNGGIDGDESVYITSGDGFYKVKGYCVYYERNQMMQDYMIQRKDARRVESGANDRVIRDFKQRMEGRKKDAVSRRGTIRTLGMLCSALSVLVLAGGVVMFNNYSKMQEMESVLVSVLPSGAKGWDKQESVGEDDIIVEEIKGGIYPETGKDSGSGDAGVAGELLQAETMAQEIYSAVPQPDLVQSEQQEPTIQSQSIEESQPIEESQSIPQSQAAGETQQQTPAQTAQIKPAEGDAVELPAETKAIPVTNMKPGESYIVGDGETLYGICFKLYDNLKYLDDICALNQLSDVNKITAGQKLILPDLTGIQ